MSKKSLLILLALCILLLASCGKAPAETPTEAPAAPTATPAPTVAPTEAPATEEPAQDGPIEGNDWRTWGLIDAFGTLDIDEGETDVCAILYEDRAELYYDRESQALFDILDYPVTLSGEEYEKAGIEFVDLNGDGHADVRVYVEEEFDVSLAMTWLWEDGALEYAPEESYFPWGGEEPENGLLPEGCPTVEDISGLWVLAEDGDIQLYIFADATLYGGVFTFVDADGTETAGTIAAYSEENPDGSVEYGYTFTTDGGDLWSTLYVGEEGVGDDLYFGQGGDPHFVRPKD